MMIRVKDGLLWKGRHAVEVHEADKIANANGFMYVERMINSFPNNKLLKLDDNLKIMTNKFKKGEKVYLKELKETAIVRGLSHIRGVNVYDCLTIASDRDTVVSEDGIMTMYEHDVEFGLVPKPRDA